MTSESNEKQKNFVRVQFDFSHEALERLDDIKEKTMAATRAEAVRNALSFYEWFLNEVNMDDTITITDHEGYEHTKAKASLFLGLPVRRRDHINNRYS